MIFVDTTLFKINVARVLKRTIIRIRVILKLRIKNSINHIEFNAFLGFFTSVLNFRKFEELSRNKMYLDVTGYLT